MKIKTETKIRRLWVDRLWHRKGYDSPDEFREHGNCFACGMDPGCALVRRDIEGAEQPHLLCLHCASASSGLTGFSYWRWFLKRDATHTISAHMLKKVARRYQPAVR